MHGHDRYHAGTAAAFCLAAVLFFARLGSLPLINPDEGRNAEVAREVQGSGTWLIPTYDGLPYLDKPIFHFKAVALSFDAFGENAAAARLPSAAFAVGLLIMLFAFCRREYGERDAALAVAIVAATPLFLVFARYVIFDMPLAFFVCGAVLAGYLAEEREGTTRRNWYLAGAAAAGGATLVKGPVGFIVPTLVLVAFFLVERRPRAIRRLFAPLNFLVFVAVVLPWFLGVTLQRPDFPYYGIVEETLARFATPAFHRTGPVYYYVPVVLGVCFAWSVLYPESIALAWRRRRRLARPDRLFMVWALVVVVFFSISKSKLPGYVLTATIALGVLTARLFGRALDRRDGRAAATVRHGTTFLTVVSLVGALLLALELAHPGLLGRWFGIHGRDFDLARRTFPTAAASLTGIGLLALAARLSRRISLAFGAFLLFPVSFLTVSFGGLEAYARADSSEPLARRVESVAPGVDLACLQCYPNGLSFYLRRPVTVITRDGSEFTSNYILFTLRKGRPWPDRVVPLEERDAWLDSRGERVLLLAGRGERAALEGIAGRRGSVAVELTPRWWGALLPPGGR